MKWLLIPAALCALGLLGYLSACAGAQRWLTFGQWWGLRSPAERMDDETSRRWEQDMREEREAEAFVDAQWKAADEWLAAEWPHATNGERAVARSVWTELARRQQDAACGVEACPKCAQTDKGQTGEYPCSECGLPTVWDEEPTAGVGEVHRG